MTDQPIIRAKTWAEVQAMQREFWDRICARTDDLAKLRDAEGEPGEKLIEALRLLKHLFWLPPPTSCATNPMVVTSNMILTVDELLVDIARRLGVADADLW
jgi:hypothetical protein